MGFLRQNRWQILIIAVSSLAAAVFMYIYYLRPYLRVGPEQPIAFSHRVHAGVKQIQCEFCHPYVMRSKFPGIPPVEKCLYCHAYIIPKHPQILKEHYYYETGMPTPWKKVNYISEHVFFNHRRHIKSQIECRECHGPVETVDRLKRRDFRMEFCITCHRQREANLDCWLACHN